jgi:hypothetical protein
MDIKFITNQPGPEGTLPINLILTENTDSGKPALKKIPGCADGFIKDTGKIRVFHRVKATAMSYFVVANKLYYCVGGIAPDHCTKIGTNDMSFTTSVCTAANSVDTCVIAEVGGSNLKVFASEQTRTNVGVPGGGSTGGTVCYMDGYFFSNKNGTDYIYYSALNDATSWPATNSLQAVGRGDNVVRVITDDRKLWAVGEDTISAYYHTGQASFPFQRINASMIESGTKSPGSVVVIDNSLYYVDVNGRTLRTKGFQKQKVSIPQVENPTGGSGTTAIGLYINGDPIYCVTNGLGTFGYNISTNSWTQFVTGAASAAWAFSTACNVGGEYIMGHSTDGSITTLSSTTYTEQSANIKCQRVTPSIRQDGKRMFFSEFYLDTLSGAAAADDITLEWSDDHGQSWSNTVTASSQTSADYGTRVIWRRLGSSRNRSFRVTTTGDIFLEIYGAGVRAQMGGS